MAFEIEHQAIVGGFDQHRRPLGHERGEVARFAQIERSGADQRRDRRFRGVVEHLELHLGQAQLDAELGWR